MRIKDWKIKEKYIGGVVDGWSCKNSKISMT